ncbi:MAG: hypothetical protein INF43_02575 [Alphaproteobacteria bacterium]|nr:hypothetical protein [Alphaproteobacteria bacterium]
MTRFYKCTLPRGRSVHGFLDAQGRNDWPLPIYNVKQKSWLAGSWKTTHDTLKPHFSGLHLAPEHMLVHWLREEIYLAETEGDVVESLDCVVAGRARLVRPMHLPEASCHTIALHIAVRALSIFKALVFPHDMVRRLEEALTLAKTGKANGGTLRVWAHAQEVVSHCERDQRSGFETNLNVLAAAEAARAVVALQRLTQETSYGWEVVKAQSSLFMNAVSGLVDDLQLRKGKGFNPAEVPQEALSFLIPHTGFSQLHHLARFNAGQWCNQLVLEMLEDRSP